MASVQPPWEGQSMRVLAVVVALALVSGCGPDSPEHPAGAVPYPPEVQAELERQMAQSSPRACDDGQSEAKLTAMRASGILADMEVGRAGLRLSVDRHRLASRPSGTLESIVEAADCAIAGPGKHLSQVSVYAADTGRTIDSFSSVELLRMRENANRQ